MASVNSNPTASCQKSMTAKEKRSAVIGSVSVLFCVIGLPMVLAGTMMIIFFDSAMVTLGYFLIGLAGAMLIIGSTIGVLICTGMIETKRSSRIMTARFQTPTSLTTAYFGVPSRQKMGYNFNTSGFPPSTEMDLYGPAPVYINPPYSGRVTAAPLAARAPAYTSVAASSAPPFPSPMMVGSNPGPESGPDLQNSLP